MKVAANSPKHAYIFWRPGTKEYNTQYSTFPLEGYKTPYRTKARARTVPEMREWNKRLEQRGFHPFNVQTPAELIESSKQAEIAINNPTFRELADEYYLDVGQFRKSAVSIKQQMKRLTDFFGDMRVTDFSKNQMRTWLLEKLKNKVYTPAYLRTIKHYVRQVLQHAAENHGIPSPLAGIFRVKLPPNSVRTHLVPFEYQLKYLRWLQEYDSDSGFAKLYAGQVYTGRRYMELTMIDWPQIEEYHVHDTVKHRAVVEWDSTKNEASDWFGIPDELWNIIEMPKEWRRGPVFPLKRSTTGGRWYPSAVQPHIRNLKAAFPDDGTIVGRMWARDTRASLITYLYKVKKIPPKIIARIVGHKDIKSTLRYCKLVDDDVNAVVWPELFESGGTNEGQIAEGA